MNYKTLHSIMVAFFRGLFLDVTTIEMTDHRTHPRHARRPSKQNGGKKTEFSLFIIESVDFEQEKDGMLEGKIIKDLLKITRQGIDVEYLYIRTWKELKKAITLFYRSNKRYLHISCHGNSEEIWLTLDRVRFNELGDQLVQHVTSRRLFFSACEVVNRRLANAVMTKSRCFSLIGPKRDITFGNAAIMWASFYHLMFRDDTADSMKSGKIRWALRRIHYAFGEEFRYYTRADNSAGYKSVDVNKK